MKKNELKTVLRLNYTLTKQKVIKLKGFLGTLLNAVKIELTYKDFFVILDSSGQIHYWEDETFSKSGWGSHYYLSHVISLDGFNDKWIDVDRESPEFISALNNMKDPFIKKIFESIINDPSVKIHPASTGMTFM